MSAVTLDTPARRRMPAQVWILTLSAFAIGTAEFVIAGILTKVAENLAITEGQAGHLITTYALAIVIGGPILTPGGALQAVAIDEAQAAFDAKFWGGASGSPRRLPSTSGPAAR